MSNRYYTSFPLALGEVILQGPEAHHLATVMRSKPGDAICLFNGDGQEYAAEVVAATKREVTLNVQHVLAVSRELPIRITIASAIPKGDRETFLIEKLVELGVSHFVPLLTERSVVVPKLERLCRGVIEASKQCGRNKLMEIRATVQVRDFVASASTDATRLIAHLRSGETRPITDYVSNTGCEVFVAIGPEGGFTDAEVESAIAAGWKPVTLGARIMRIETAAIAAASYFSLRA